METIEHDDVSVPAERRRDARTPVRWTAACRHRGITLDSIAVVDASNGGLGLGVELPFPVGELLCLDLADIGRLSFRIAWKGGGRTGLAVVEDRDALSDGDVASLAGVLSASADVTA